VLDDGRLTDGHGRTVDFTNTLIVMTSNIGSQSIQKIAEEGGSEEEMLNAVQQALKTRFLPEFLNRIDEMIVFEPLRRQQIRSIVQLQVERLRKQLLQSQIRLEITPAAIDAIASEGYDPAFGARPLKRVIQRRLQNALANELLKGDIGEGGVVEIDYRDEDFVFTAGQPQATAY
jgi:ATP-dependent Clp protease ATP-binding subunit ClpB